jgi:monofunctional biosynthetic peptidoglycan transglycosylase
LRRAGRFILRLLIVAHVLYFGSVALVLGLWKISNPGATSLMVYRKLTAGTNIRPVRFIPYGEISAGTRNAFIQLEDHDFWTHWGISPDAIKDAMAINKQLGRTVYGASTITQQLARTLFLSPERTWLRKYLEAGTAILLEQILGKRRILELYMNYIEFGPGIFGLGSAARYHYGQSFDQLNYDERIKLAVIITSPLRWTVDTMWKNRGMVARYNALTRQDLP